MHVNLGACRGQSSRTRSNQTTIQVSMLLQLKFPIQRPISRRLACGMRRALMGSPFQLPSPDVHDCCGSHGSRRCKMQRTASSAVERLYRRILKALVILSDTPVVRTNQTKQSKHIRRVKRSTSSGKPIEIGAVDDRKSKSQAS